MVPRESAVYQLVFHRDHRSSRARSRDRGGRIPRARRRTTARTLGNDVRPRQRRDAGRTAERLARMRTSGRPVSRVPGIGRAMADGGIPLIAHGGVPRAPERGRAPGVPEPPVAEVRVGYDGAPAVQKAAHEVFGSLVLALQARRAAVSASNSRGGPRGGHSRDGVYPAARTTQGSRRPPPDRRQGSRVRPGVRRLRSHLRVLVRPPRRLHGLRAGADARYPIRTFCSPAKEQAVIIFSARRLSACHRQSSSPPLYLLPGGGDVYFPLMSYRNVLSSTT